MTLRLRGRVCHFAASATGHTPESIPNVTAGTEDLAIELRPSMAVSGHVVDTGGRPVPRVTVALHSGPSIFSERRGRGGGRRGRGGRLGGARNRNEASGEEGGQEAERALARSASFLRLATPHSEVVSDAAGRFLFADVPESDYLLIAQKTAYVPKHVAGRLSERPASNEAHVEIVVERGSVIAGIVEDSSGKPVPGALVAIGQDGGNGRNRFGQGRWDGRTRGTRGNGRRGRGGGQPNERNGEERQESEPDPEEGSPEPISLARAAAAVETDVEGRFKLPAQYKIGDLEGASRIFEGAHLQA